MIHHSEMATVQEIVYEKMSVILKSNQVNTESPFAIMTKSMEVIHGLPQEMLKHEKKNDLLIAVLTRIAAGVDGVQGTADDILPSRVIEEIKKMIDNDLVNDFARVVKDVSNGKFDFSTVAELAPKAAPMCMGCFGGNVKL